MSIHLTQLYERWHFSLRKVSKCRDQMQQRLESTKMNSDIKPCMGKYHQWLTDLIIGQVPIHLLLYILFIF